MNKEMRKRKTKREREQERNTEETDIKAAEVSILLSFPSSWEQQKQDNQNKHLICSLTLYQPSLIMQFSHVTESTNE